jgi:hypothetical protein
MAISFIHQTALPDLENQESHDKSCDLTNINPFVRAVFWVILPCKMIDHPDDGGSTHL